jgi:hypothetical protein
MIRVRVNWSGVNEGFSVMHFGDAIGSAQVAADAVEDWLDDIDASMALGQAMQVDTEVEEVDPATGNILSVANVTTVGKTGAVSGAPVPQVAQALFRWRTGQYINGREVRGRTFVPGLALAATDTQGEIASATVAGLQTAAAAFVTASGIGVWSPANGTFELATSASVWPEFAVMRSRRD